MRPCNLLALALVAASCALLSSISCAADITSAASTKPLALSGYRSKAAAAAEARTILASSAWQKRNYYSSWRKRYSKSYDDRRYRAWLSNLDAMAKWNSRPNPPFLKGMNGLSDYTPAELSRLLMRRSDPSRARTRDGSVSVGGAAAADTAAAAAGSSKAPLPNEWNWVTRGKVSEVRDQTLGGGSGCGSCWAFAALGALESRARIDGTDSGPNYSEQQMIDCVTQAAGYTSYGCAGGTSEDVFNFASTSFVSQENGYRPYVAQNGTGCRAASAVGAVTVKPSPGYNIVAGNPEAIMRAIVETGPVVAYLFVLPAKERASLLYYDAFSGSYPARLCADANPSDAINHAVVIVGYSLSEKYWILRNSWGTWWGNGGYGRLEMTSGGNGPCNLYRNGVLAPRKTVKYVKPASPPPLAPVRLPNAEWRVVASDASGRVLAVTAGRPFNPGYVFVSRDGGLSWFNCSSLGSGQWQSLSISGDGKVLLAAGWGSALLTSSDGLTWTRRVSSGVQQWQRTAASLDGQQLVAAGQGDFGEPGNPVLGSIVTSNNGGKTWTQRQAAGLRYWSEVSSSGDGKLFFAAGRNYRETAQRFFYSNDFATTWTERPLPFDFLSGIVMSGNGARLLAHNSTCVVSSTDGGATWRPAQCIGDWQGTALSADGSRFFAVRGGGAFRSSDGQNWSACGSLPASCKSVASSGNGSRVIVGTDESVFVSTDGCASWKQA